MLSALRIEEIYADPDCITETFDFEGESITFRALRSDDGDLFGRYLEDLSEATERLFRPHALTMEAGRKVCEEVDRSGFLRLIATTSNEMEETAIAYLSIGLGARSGEIARYEGYGIGLDDQTDCLFAPSVADAYQNCGLGSVLAPRVLTLAKRLGYKRMVLQGGTQKVNHRGIHFYEKLGFVTVGEFVSSANLDGQMVSIGNWDMMLDLT